MANSFIIPNNVVFGKEALNASGSYIKEFGKKALIITDNMMVKLGNIDKVIEVIKSINLDYEVYSEVNSEPTDVIVNKGIDLYKDTNCDFLIALGGGSPIDAMKAIGAMITNEGDITDYLGKVIPNKLPKMVAIPTTAGTGSEATQFTIISDTKNNIKMLLKGPSLMPDLAVIDPVFTLTAPKSVTSATGLDALTHAIEAYTSRKSQALSDTFAISAVKRIFKNLPIAYEKGNDINARSEMAIGALEAGIAFNNSSVTIVHGMSRPIGALFHVPHGLSNAMLLKDCLEFAKEGCVERLNDLAKAIGINAKDENEGADLFVEAVKDLCDRLNIMTIEEFGIEREEFLSNLDKMANDALESGSPSNTMKIPTKDEIIEIYKSLVKVGVKCDFS